MAWLGMGEIIVILILALILFGPKKLPELGKLIGSGLREMRKYTSLSEDEPPEIEPPADIPDELTESPDIMDKNFDESKYPGNLTDENPDSLEITAPGDSKDIDDVNINSIENKA
ncbi:MAG: twin-arginine translocase TatA/TatE family subunit [Candidatus Eremiobacteraeota bacterium]|nr:twin-arginine translocase TatA/TatE family subunit [Candidatus Eremiobacteraeota bacterium]